MSKPRLPAHLHAAYNWTDAAGEIALLAGLSEHDAIAYCRESAANSREHANEAGDVVTESELSQLHSWLRGPQ